MKLTQDRLKRIIKEELEKILNEEAIPKDIRDMSQQGKINYNNLIVPYFYFVAEEQAKQPQDLRKVQDRIKKIKDGGLYDDGAYRIVKSRSNLEKKILTDVGVPQKEWNLFNDNYRGILFVMLGGQIDPNDSNKLLELPDLEKLLQNEII